MKKFFSLFFVLFCVFVSKATVFVFTESGSVSQTIDGITVTLAKGSGNNEPFFSVAEEMRLYANNTITVQGAEIKDISLTFAKQGSKEYASLSANTGSLVSGGTSTSSTDFKTDKWIGSAANVTFTLGSTGQRIITRVVVNGTGNETTDPGTDPSNPTDPTDPDLPSTLDPNYTYDEPTEVAVPNNMTVQGDAYWFIDNNIQVSCTKGAVNGSYFSAHAGFEMTFTATQPIKGVVINGFVKKEFSATVNHGKISYLTPSEDSDGTPVVVITDVDSKSVTVSCVKQLRCYSVEVYFDSNPDAVVSGGSSNPGSSSTEDLTFDSAEAVYESDYVDWIGEENYSVFLYNAASPYSPYLALDIYPLEKDKVEGSYKMSDYSLGDYTYFVYGDSEDDIAWAEAGEVTISKSGNVFNIQGYIVCDNSVRYNFTFTGEMPFYLDSDYYGDGDDDPDAGVDFVEVDKKTPELDREAPMYDIQGRRVSDSYRGVVIQNGRKFKL